MHNDSFHQKEGRQLTRDGRYILRILLQESEKRFVFLVRKRHSIVVWLALCCCVKVWVSFLSSFDHFILEILIVTMWHEIFAGSNFCDFSSNPQK